MLSFVLRSVLFALIISIVSALHQTLSLIIGFDRINFALVVVIFTGVIFRYAWALIFAVAAGFIVDQFSLIPGSMSIPLLVAILLVNTLFIHFFTNRSLWTLLLLGGVGTIIAYVVHATFLWSFTLFLPSLGTQLFLHSILFIFFFFMTNTFSARLKPYILVRG